ncbi:hypothetical protein JHW43_009656, partial [Diplocarpon mali]
DEEEGDEEEGDEEEGDEEEGDEEEGDEEEGDEEEGDESDESAEGSRGTDRARAWVDGEPGQGDEDPGQRKLDSLVAGPRWRICTVSTHRVLSKVRLDIVSSAASTPPALSWPQSMHSSPFAHGRHTICAAENRDSPETRKKSKTSKMRGEKKSSWRGGRPRIVGAGSRSHAVCRIPSPREVGLRALGIDLRRMACLAADIDTRCLRPARLQEVSLAVEGVELLRPLGPSPLVPSPILSSPHHALKITTHPLRRLAPTRPRCFNFPGGAFVRSSRIIA